MSVCNCFKREWELKEHADTCPAHPAYFNHPSPIPRWLTVTIQAGNSDDKLNQKEWSGFVTQLQHAVDQSGGEVHFFGAPPNHAPWQNACWVVSVGKAKVDALLAELTRLRKTFRQESIAITKGETEFI